MDGRTYDPGSCVTAGELRAAGVPVPAEMPDAAWAPRDAFRIAVQQRVEYPLDADGNPDLGAPLADAREAGAPIQCAANLVGKFVVPFRWDVRQ